MTTHVVAGRPSVVMPETEIRWAPVSQSVRVSFEGTNQATVSRALTAVFGNFPIRLSKEHHWPMILAMRAAAGEGYHPYTEIASALEKFGELELTEA